MIAERPRSPAARRVLVERVDRAGNEREHEPDRRCEQKGRKDIDSFRAGRMATVDHRPPESDPRAEIHHVLDVKERVRVPEREVVRPREMPDDVGEKPRR